MNDELLSQLLELHRELSLRDIPIVLGGGMSLYLRTTYLKPSAPRRYPFTVEARSTNDLDLFLSSELISSKEKVEGIKETLSLLGYRVDPKAKNFQFMKEIPIRGSLQMVRVDLLSSPPSSADLKKVEIKKPRIKPKAVSGFHAYLAEEAEGIDIGKVAIPLRWMTQDPMQAKDAIFVPSGFNYLILKLHAFHDRKDRTDDKSDYGRHHAYDIFSTVVQMNENDWSVARGHFEAHQEMLYLRKAAEIRRECFSRASDSGVIRLRENVAFRSNRERYEPYLQQFLDDLRDLFPIERI